MSKKRFFIHPISILSISEVIFVFSAYDTVHQQERHLWSIYEETRCLFATQRRGYIRQIHKHVIIPQIISPTFCIFLHFYYNRRYQDKSSAKHNLDDFLKSAYAKQMKELNGTTGKATLFNFEIPLSTLFSVETNV